MSIIFKTMGTKRSRSSITCTETSSDDECTKRPCLATNKPQQHDCHPTTPAAPARQYCDSRIAQVNPVSFVQFCLRSRGLNGDIRDFDSTHDHFLKTTDEHLASYELDIIQAVRKNDIEYLRAARDNGKSLQCCNVFGESICHLACRRSSVDLVSYLVTEGKVSLNVRDDYGRTPLHDACWKMDPNFELVDLILDLEPELLLIADKRGHSPLDYCRREHWGAWVIYLSTRMKKEIRNRMQKLKS